MPSDVITNCWNITSAIALKESMYKTHNQGRIQTGCLLAGPRGQSVRLPKAMGPKGQGSELWWGSGGEGAWGVPLKALEF